uniref:Uncharacterized protein n=1 Tax=Cacopsylla melanoneura TaxID=428564 RepID=A0A8D8RRC1_9HEMI
MIPKQEKTKAGYLKYYTNIMTGQYFTWDPKHPNKIKLYTRRSKHLDGKQMTSEISVDTKVVIGSIIANMKLKQDHDYEDNPCYEVYFLKQIIQFQQFLFSFRYEVNNAGLNKL